MRDTIESCQKHGWAGLVSRVIALISMSCLIGFFTSQSAESAEKGLKTDDGIGELAVDALTGNLSNRFFGNLDIGYEHSYWDINDQEGNPVIEYETEGLELVKFIGNLGYGYSPLLTIWYETSPSPSDKQDEMLRIREAQESRVELFKGQIAADALIMYLIPDGSLLKKFLRNMLSIRYRYTRELFYGEATAIEDAFYISDSAFLDYNSHVVSGGVPIEAGTKTEFGTIFEESEISIPLVKFDAPVMEKTASGPRVAKIAKYALRLGYYQSVWERPSSTRSFTVNSRPVIYNARYRSRGLLVSIETLDVGSPGFNCDLSFRSGYDDQYETPIDWEGIYGKDVEVSSAAYDLKLWYNLYFSNDRSRGWFLTLGGSWSAKAMDVDTKRETQNGMEFDTRIHDTDETRKLYATIAYRF